MRLNFDQCVTMALRENSQILASVQDIEVSKAKRIEAHPNFIPVVKYQHRIAPVPQDTDNASGSFFDGDISVFNNFKVEVGSAVSTFGKIKTAQALAELGIDAAELKSQRSADETVLKIYQAYQGILLARDLKALGKQAHDALQGKINELEKDSVHDQLQILRLKVAIYEVERKLEEANKKEELALSGLKLLIGIDHDVSLDLMDSDLKQVSYKVLSLNAYVDKAHQYLPEYKLLATGIEALEKKLKLEKLNYAPNLGMGGFFDIGRAPNIRGSSSDEDSFNNPFNFTKAGIGFELKGELDFVKTRAKVKQAQAELNKSLLEKKAAFQALDLDIEKSYLDLREAETLLVQAIEAKKAARQMVFLTKSNMDIGIGEKKDYLDAIQSYLIFQGRELEAIFNYNLAVYSLKRKIGELVPKNTMKS